MKAGRREKDPFSWRAAEDAAMHGERGRIDHKTAYGILAHHHQTGRCSRVPGCIEVLDHYTDRRGFGGCEWQTIPLTLGALRDWLGY